MRLEDCKTYDDLFRSHAESLIEVYLLGTARALQGFGGTELAELQQIINQVKIKH